MKLEKICEVIVYVEDMGKMVGFYRDILGLEVTYPADKDDYSDEYWVTFATGVCTLALHGGGKGGKIDGAPKYVFEVDDVAATKKELEGRGVEIGPTREPAPGVVVCDGWDIEGNVFSLESQS